MIVQIYNGVTSPWGYAHEINTLSVKALLKGFERLGKREVCFVEGTIKL